MMATTQAVENSHQIILVVEDEALIRDLLSEVLESEGMEVVAKSDADQALAYLTDAASDVALILTDINMPGSMNGAQLANYSMRVWPAIPIVAMSGMETFESAGICAEVRFLRKPFAMADMVSSVRTALAGAVQ